MINRVIRNSREIAYITQLLQLQSNALNLYELFLSAGILNTFIFLYNLKKTKTKRKTFIYTILRQVRLMKSITNNNRSIVSAAIKIIFTATNEINNKYLRSSN